MLPAAGSLETGEEERLVEAVIIPLSGDNGSGSYTISEVVDGDSELFLDAAAAASAAAASAITFSFSRILLGGLGFFIGRLCLGFLL